jgi:tripartite-type tricarboxylate transporter receptor subunit TctC
MVFAATLAVVALSTQASAQTWPSRPIKMIVPFPAGGGTDFIARLMAKHLSDRLGQQVFVENRGGANGAIGMQAVKQADPDGYTISTCSDSPLVVNPSLYPKLPYQPLTDFVPIATMVKFPGVITAHPSANIRSIADLITAAKAKPGGISYASAGIGNFSHLAMELFAMKAGVKLLHVPYKGTGPAAMAIVGGEVQLTYNNIQTTLQSIREKQIIALGVGEANRVPVLPDVPAIGETVPGFQMAPWVGVVAPANTPKEIVERLSREVTEIMKRPDIIKILTEQQVTPFSIGPAEFAKLMKDDTVKWAELIKTVGIKVE